MVTRKQRRAHAGGDVAFIQTLCNTGGSAAIATRGAARRSERVVCVCVEHMHGAWAVCVLAAVYLCMSMWRMREEGAPRAVTRRIRRLRDVRAYLEQPSTGAVPVGAWQDVDVSFPDVSDRHTLKMLARLACWAYYEHVPRTIADAPGWHWSSKFGWESDGLRGQVFATEGNASIIVALKGTSASFLPGGETGQQDKDNDNLLFSCCCARVSKSWTPVCDCYGDDKTCDTACLGRTLLAHSLYYPAATDLYNMIAYMYPQSQVWVTGHSLGGVMASLLGATFGVPAVAFESPGDRLAAQRLHVPLPPADANDTDAYAMVPVTHVYHTADSLATGQCVGSSSLCSRTGFAIETRCHIGQSVVYDTVRYLGWSVGVIAHRITYVISELLSEDWDRRVLRDSAVKAEPLELGAVPAARRETACVDCSAWTFR